MNLSRIPLLLAVLLFLSVSLNVWLFVRPSSSPDVSAPAPVLRVAENRSAPDAPPRTKNQEKTETKQPEPAADRTPEQTENELATLTEDELIFGGMHKLPDAPVPSEPAARVSPERLKALARAEPSKAEKFRIHAVLHLPGNRTVDFGSSDIEPGSLMKFERLKEFPFPTSIKLAQSPAQTGSSFPVSPTTRDAADLITRVLASRQSDSSFPVSPTTPGDFEWRNTGIVVEVDVSPAAGTLILGGHVTHRWLAGMARMPGEIFSPIYTTGVSESGSPVDVILTENKVLQPQFSVSETPFLAAVTSGQPCRVPVRMAFGQTDLELTCTPLE